jgi:hypothetical protein
MKPKVPDGIGTVREVPSKTEEIAKSDVAGKWRLESKAWLSDKLKERFSRTQIGLKRDL